MRVKIGNQKAAQYMLSNDSCQKCIFYSNSLAFYITMDCDINGIFSQTGTLERFLSYENRIES